MEKFKAESRTAVGLVGRDGEIMLNGASTPELLRGEHRSYEVLRIRVVRTVSNNELFLEVTGQARETAHLSLTPEEAKMLVELFGKAKLPLAWTVRPVTALAAAT